jgi:hypothetical protein
MSLSIWTGRPSWRSSSGGAHERVAQPCHRGEHRAGVGHRELDVVAGADGAAQVAQRAAQEARADVDAEDERGLVDRLEEQRAVARAAGIVAGLAHEPGRHQRLQGQRDGRLGDARAARDLGARDRAAAADSLEDRALVEVLQQRGRGAARGDRVRHIVREPNSNPGHLGA